MNTHWRVARGVTVLELIITIALVAVLASLGVPNWSRLVAASRQTAAVNQLLGAVQTARTVAIARNQAVVLCPNTGHDRCATGSDLWDAGYLIFVHDPPSRPYQVTDAASLIAVRALPERMSAYANRIAFVFRPLAVRSSNGTIKVCDPLSRVPPKAVIVSVTGRPRISDRLANGQPIPCPDAPSP